MNATFPTHGSRYEGEKLTSRSITDHGRDNRYSNKRESRHNSKVGSFPDSFADGQMWDYGLSDGVSKITLIVAGRSIFVELFNDSQLIEVDECTS